jgi:hypothetical protein
MHDQVGGHRQLRRPDVFLRQTVASGIGFEDPAVEDVQLDGGLGLRGLGLAKARHYDDRDRGKHRQGLCVLHHSAFS